MTAVFVSHDVIDATREIIAKAEKRLGLGLELGSDSLPNPVLVNGSFKTRIEEVL